MNQYIQAKQGNFQKILELFKKEISSLRTGRANPGIFDAVFVEAYGAKTQLSAVGNIAVSDARSMTITPWDKNIIKEIEKALVEANLGVGIVNEGAKIRVSVPAMTEENRKDLAKKLNEKAEKTRIAFRQVRDEIKTMIETAEKAKEINEDDKFRFLKELDEDVRKWNDEVEVVKKKKEEDIMTI
jgi:ribosome recycling factor